MPDDLTALPDDDLAALRLAVLVEQERRQRIESIPGQIATLKQEYLDAGGNPDNLPASVEQTA